MKHPNTSLRVNMRGGRIYITMTTGDTKVTMALTAEEALAVSSYLQAKAQAILSRGTFIGVRGTSTTTMAKTAKARTKAKAKAAEAKEETVTAPKQVEPESGEEEEDVGEE